MKRIIALFAVLFALSATLFAGAGRAMAESAPVTAQPELPLVADYADVFTDEQEASLEARVRDMVNSSGHGYVLLTDTYNYGKSQDLYAADFLYDNGYWNETNDGATVFYLSLESGNRGWRTISIGANERIFTQDVCYYIDELVDSNMRAGNYYQAFSDQVDYVAELFRTGEAVPIEGGATIQKEDGKTVIVSNGGSSKALSKIAGQLPTGLIVGFIIGLVVVSGMKKSMKLNPEKAANNYLVRGSFVLRNCREMFLFRTVTKTPKPKDTSRGGSSFGGGHSSSGGHYSGGGRNF